MPLTATLQRCSHMIVSSSLWRSARQPELRQRDLVVQRLEYHLDAASDFRFGVRCLEQIAGEKGTGRVVELDDDARVRHRGREALVAGVIHDRVRVDRALPPHRLERELGRYAVDAGCVGGMLEMSAA